MGDCAPPGAHILRGGEELLRERRALSAERLREIPAEEAAGRLFRGFFRREALSLSRASGKAGEERAEALTLFVPEAGKKERLLAALSSICSRVFMPQCAPETEVRCIELFLQCYALLSQGGGEEALCEAMYYDLFDYAEEDVRERFTERNKGGYSLSLTLPGEPLWYADRFPAIAAAHTEDLYLFLDKALRDRLRHLICEASSRAEREQCRESIVRYQNMRGADTAFSPRQQLWLRELYTADNE